jgi:aryl-alcohol dehydrogenase-like predicted oxidoreductase
MEIRNLGQSGLRVSAIGLGCNNFGGRSGPEETRAAIAKALDLGITLFDTAVTYGNRGGSEELMGQILGDDRKRIVLATKFANPMDDLIRQGKVRYIGCSNFPAWQVVEAQWTARANGLNAFVSCQDEYLLLKCDPEPQLLPAMRKYGLGLLPYAPLASGLLTGKYRRDAPKPAGTRLVKDERLAGRFLTERNWSVA